VEKLHSIPRRKRLATHGSHEYTMENEKGKFLIATVLPKIFPKDDDLSFILAFLS